MATVYVDGVAGLDTNSGIVSAPVQTIEKAGELVLAGDTIHVASAIYTEEVVPTQSNLTYWSDPDDPAILDGGETLFRGFYEIAYLLGLVVDGFEIRNYRHAGLEIVYGFTGTPYASGNAVRRCHIHHIDSLAPETFTSPGEEYAYGIRQVGGDPEFTDNEIHHVGPGGESHGIWTGYCNSNILDSNRIYLCRLSGIRDYHSLSPEITSNILSGCWIGAELSGSISALMANNYALFNEVGLYPKHTNHEPFCAEWGLTLATIPAWSRLWHNTLYKNRWTSVELNTNGEEANKTDIRNNIFAGAGSDFMHDSETPLLRGEVLIDHNVYSTHSPRAANVYRKGFNDPPLAGEIKTFAQMQAALGWETNGVEIDPELIDPENGDLDYSDTSPVHNSGVNLASVWGTQMGARGLPGGRFVKWLDATPLADSESDVPYYMFDANYFTLQYFWSLPGWATADLGSEKTVTHYSDDAMPSDMMVKGHKLEVSLNGSSWTTVDEGDYPDSAASSRWIELAGGPVAARYLRYTVTSTWGAASAVTPGVGVGSVVDNAVESVSSSGYWGVRAA